MLKNYFKISLRNLYRNKSFSIINILGLVVGLSFSCMLYVYVSHELSYDTFHSKSDRTFRVLTMDGRDPENPRTYGVTVPAIGSELVSRYPEVESMVRLHRFSGQVVLEHNGQNFQERNWYTTSDPNFFDVLNFEFISGDPSTALQAPQSLVLTESMAKKYFGVADALGEVLSQTSLGAVKITGVIKDHPGNSHLKFDMLFSRSGGDQISWNQYLNSWEDFGAYTYIVLREPHAIHSLRSKIPALRDEKLAKFEGGMDIGFQALEDIYLGSDDIVAGIELTRGQRSYIYIFSSMGIFLLIIACINYINLATSRAMMRSREVGVRKAVGAAKRQLFIQFLMESFVITFISALLAILVMDLSFPYFNQITGKDFDISGETLASYLPALVVIAIIMGVVSGGYPAFYLSRLKPVSSLRGREVSQQGNISLRKVLVVFQFVITIVMIVSMLVVGRQLNFIHTRDIGFDKNRLMVIDINSGNVRERFRAVKNEYAGIPGVEHVAVSTRVPGEWKNIDQLYVSSAASPAGSPDSLQSYFMGFDEDMLVTYGMQLADGRYFSSNERDSTLILLNESAVKAMRLSNPIGAEVDISMGDGTQMTATVIGVLRDFNFQSLHQKIAPIVIGAWNSPFAYIDYFTLKITGDTEAAVAAATRVHEKFDEYTPIEYHFLDRQLESFYQAEQRAGMIFRMGGALSIFVACLGLFGLATYNIQRRTKELGIRKVLGATGLNLFVLLSSSFAKQVFIAFFVATPIAWYVMDKWLAVFEYRVTLHAGIFLTSGLIALIIALGTVGYRTLKAVRANPVDSLRQE